MTGHERLPVVVLISGNGSNLQAFIEGQCRGELPIDLRAVISNRADAYGLQRASAAGIATRILRHGDYPDRERYDRALRAEIDRHQPGLVILAGFMRILTPAFVAHYEGRLINIHPSLLPDFRGLHTHRRALESGTREHGCSVHFVTPELDAGPVILQASVPVRGDDTERTLERRVQSEEHRAYPLAVRWLAEGRARWRDGTVLFDNITRTRPPRLTPETDVHAILAPGEY